MKKYTKEEKKENVLELRNSWKVVKEVTDIDETLALMAFHGIENVSVTSFAFILRQMEELGLPGIPYVDMKTYKGWKENGFQVRKGEKAKIKGVTWIGAKTENEEGTSSRCYPKAYSLFHSSQTEPRI